MNYDSKGFIKISARTAADALPVENINVRISGNEEGTVGIEYSLVTGRDGTTEVISLPTPNKIYSQSPGAEEQAYATYDIEVFGEGYYPKKITDVAIFSGITSILTVNMIPDAGIIRNISSPTSTNSINIQENEDLN